MTACQAADAHLAVLVSTVTLRGIPATVLRAPLDFIDRADAETVQTNPRHLVYPVKQARKIHPSRLDPVASFDRFFSSGFH